MPTLIALLPLLLSSLILLHPVYPYDATLSKSRSSLRLKHILHRDTAPKQQSFKRFDIPSPSPYSTSNYDQFVHTVSHYHGPRIRPTKSQIYNSNSNLYSQFHLTNHENQDSWVWTQVDNEQLILPDPEDKETILSLAGMTANAYTEPTRSDWIDLNPDYHTNTSFGWNDSGIRGYVFASENDDLLVVAIKGTSAAFMGIGGGPTGGNDKINDNRMFSCCCARVDRTWRTVCDCYTGVGGVCNITCIKQNADFEGSYYRAGKDIFGAVSQLYPHATIWFTGHSLGGALSALLGLTFNLPAVSFEAPGELMYAQRLGLPIPPDMSVLPIYHFGHNADPVFLGSCRGPRSSCYFAGYAIETKCHLGHKCQYNVRESANPTSSPDPGDGDDDEDNPPGEDNPITTTPVASETNTINEYPPAETSDNQNNLMLMDDMLENSQFHIQIKPNSNYQLNMKFPNDRPQQQLAPITTTETVTTTTTVVPEPTAPPVLNWRVDIRHHRIHEVINYVIKPWPGVAKCKPVQKNCRDCVGWEFV